MKVMKVMIWPALVLLVVATSSDSQPAPNVLILLVDDLGVGDLGCYGNTSLPTPNMDSLAREGARLTHHLAAATLCSPSRAALLTGQYASRLGLAGGEGEPRVVLYAAGRVGLPPGVPTLASLARQANYSTGAVGKWHLGLHGEEWGDQQHGPLGHGFQYFFGLPFTLVEGFEGGGRFLKLEQMVEEFPLLAGALLALIPLRWLFGRKTWFCFVFLTLSMGWLVLEHFTFTSPAWWQRSLFMEQLLNSFLMENQEVVQKPVELEGLESLLVARSISFLEQSVARDQPFLLYHAFPAVHTPLVPGEQWQGSTKHGSYGDTIAEVDWAVGELLSTLDRLGVADNTLVYLVSDHGGDEPQLGSQGGWNGQFRGGKGNGALEGGVRVPGLVRWPGRVKPGTVIHEPTSLLDLVPSLCSLLSLPTPPGDGVSLLPRLLGQQAQLQPRTLLHHCGAQVFAARRSVGDGRVFKLILREPLLSPGSQGCPGDLCPCHGPGVRLNNPPLLYQISSDPREDHPLPLSLPEYRQVADTLLEDIRQYEAEPKPASQLGLRRRVMPAPWLQPLLSVSLQ